LGVGASNEEAPCWCQAGPFYSFLTSVGLSCL
jgi:hypothetical protein